MVQLCAGHIYRFISFGCRSETQVHIIERNRKISVGRVAMYEHDMLSGKWADNGATIKIDTEGRLIDGQHRLKAIEKTGVTQWLWVARNVKPIAFSTIDTGGRRTPKQLFEMTDDPLRSKKTAMSIAGFCFKAFLCVTKASQEQLLEFIEANREVLNWLYSTVKSAETASAFYLVAAIAMHMHNVPDSEINGFIEGAGKNLYDPAKSATAVKHCIRAENSRKTALRSFTVGNLREIERCAYSYAHNMQYTTSREDPFPMQMDSKYKLVKA